MSNLINFRNSIINNAGASYNLLTGEFNPDHGYMVSIQDAEKIIPYNPAENIDYEIASYIKHNAHILIGNVVSDSNFLGAWVTSGKLYFDCSVIVENQDDAERLARENNQLAYYDNKNKVEIFI